MQSYYLHMAMPETEPSLKALVYILLKSVLKTLNFILGKLSLKLLLLQ